MKRSLAFIAAAAMLLPGLAVPQFASAQSARNYGEDPCRDQQRSSANKGTVAGGVIGALVGSQVAGHGDRTAGALLGGAAGAVAGHQIGKHQVNCTGYPRRISQTRYSRANCRWVQEYYGGRNHSFEVCRGRDGVWRPSGRG
jgi:hypothetical protein